MNKLWHQEPSVNKIKCAEALAKAAANTQVRSDRHFHTPEPKLLMVLILGIRKPFKGSSVSNGHTD